MVKEALPILDHGHHFLLVNLALLLEGMQVATVDMTNGEKKNANFYLFFHLCFKISTSNTLGL